MSVIPTKFQCDAENCTAIVEFFEGENRNWYVVALSKDPAYVAINRWTAINRIPDNLKKWHACSWAHALQLQEAASVNL